MAMTVHWRLSAGVFPPQSGKIQFETNMSLAVFSVQITLSTPIFSPPLPLALSLSPIPHTHAYPQTLVLSLLISLSLPPLALAHFLCPKQPVQFKHLMAHSHIQFSAVDFRFCTFFPHRPFLLVTRANTLLSSIFTCGTRAPSDAGVVHNSGFHLDCDCF